VAATAAAHAGKFPDRGAAELADADAAVDRGGHSLGDPGGRGRVVVDGVEAKRRVERIDLREGKGARRLAAGARSPGGTGEGADGAVEIPDHGAQGIRVGAVRTDPAGAGTPR